VEEESREDDSWVVVWYEEEEEEDEEEAGGGFLDGVVFWFFDDLTLDGLDGNGCVKFLAWVVLLFEEKGAVVSANEDELI
jgi:hypothetical protein